MISQDNVQENSSLRMLFADREPAILKIRNNILEKIAELRLQNRAILLEILQAFVAGVPGAHTCTLEVNADADFEDQWLDFSYTLDGDWGSRLLTWEELPVGLRRLAHDSFILEEIPKEGLRFTV